METRRETTISWEVQRARSLLAELCEIGAERLTREKHLEVLFAFDQLAKSAKADWPPPLPASGLDEIELALLEVKESLARVSADPELHEVEPLAVALAANHVELAVGNPE